jgi:holo-[acyl-carrier-protein] synthase
MLGVDIVEVSRIENLYNKYRDKFLKIIFNQIEIEILKRKNYNINSMAGLFACKEAVSKANETGIGEISFKDIKIFYKQGSPYAKLFNDTYKLSISHDGGFAIAIAMKLKPKINKIKRNQNTHKGDYGRVGIFAGSKGMCGAAYLSTMAALRMGAGLVYNYVSEDIFDIMSIKYVEAIVKSYENLDYDLLNKLDSIAIGMGLSKSERSKKIINEILNLDKKIVIDADGLNILAENLDLLAKRKDFSTILTPHPVEFQRLSGLSLEEINSNKEEVCKEFSEKYKVILLLKGNKTLVTDSKRIYINSTGNAGMATAGSGDVLSGVIAALLARGLNVYDAACAGAYIHGKAGDIASRRIGEEYMLASDIIKSLGYATSNIYYDKLIETGIEYFRN